MRASSLTRLRVAFVLLGVTLLGALFLLVRSAQAQLEAQRRLRHQIVAERMFDEMERELTLLLEREDARPTSAYDAQNTRSQSWAPFVVGYFTRDASGIHTLAKDQLDPARAEHVERAAQACRLRAAVDGRADVVGDLVEKQTPSPAASAPASAPEDAILRKLNRATTQRQFHKQQSSPNDHDHIDPLSGLE